MFRDLKEYQSLQKLYEEKVSKVENINEENVRGANMKGSVNVGNMFKKIGDALKPKPIVRPEGTTSVRQSGVNTVNTNKNVKVDRSRNIPVMDGPVNNPEYGKNMSRSKEDLNPSKVDTSNEIESDANYAKTNARFNQRFNKDVKIVRNSQMSGRQRAQEMAKKRIAAKEAGTYKKPKTAQELAKERIAAKEAGTYQKPKTAQELAKERIAAKQRLKDIKVENYTPYDMVLEYLLSTEQAATIEEANYVMMQLDEENIQEIVKAGLGAMKAIGKFGAKSPLHFAGTLATTAAVAPTVGKLAYKATETAGNVVNKIANFDPIGDARKENIKKKQREYEKKSGTTKDDGYFYDPTVDGKR